MKNRKIWIFGIVLAALIPVSILISLSYGSRSVSIGSVFGAFFENGAPQTEVDIVNARIPRTVFGLIAGAALGTSGLLMQSITRNPVADPSILGVNTGASLFVVIGMAFFNIGDKNQYIWLAFTGAVLTAALVFGLASSGKGGATPMKLAIAGAATATALQSIVNTVMLPNSQVMDRFRFWQTGSIGGASWDDIKTVIPYLAGGFIIAIALIPSLNALALGDEFAAGLGVNVARTRILGIVAGVLLCAATTAIAGPIGFIGLMVPHVMKLVLGPDLKLLVPFSMMGGAILLLLSDVAGRLLGSPGELESGIITALVGGPAFILIVRKVRVRSV